MTVVDLASRRHQHTAPALSPMAASMAQAEAERVLMNARVDAEELLSLARLLASTYRTYTTPAGLERAEQIRRRMQLILRMPR